MQIKSQGKDYLADRRLGAVKIFIFDNFVIVGSANVSKHSRDQLVETAIVTNKKNILEVLG